MKRIGILPSLVLSTLCMVTQGHVSPAQFSQWLEEAHAPASTVREDLRRAAHFRYVFVNGFRNEVRYGDFSDEVSRLRTLGVPGKAIHILNPSSERSVEQNIPYLLKDLTALAAQGPEQLVIVGHSKGATESLAAVLAAPSPLADRLQSVFLFQGPFHGSPLADLASRLRPLAELIHYGHGAFCLAPKEMDAFWKEFLPRHRDAVERLTDRIYYLTTFETPARMPAKLRPGAEYMEIVAGKNDGLVPLESQWLQELGTRLDPLRAYHNETVAIQPRTPSKIEFREALSQAIFETAAAQD